MKLVSQIGFVFLVALGFFAWGFLSLKYDYPPSRFIDHTISDVTKFVEGHDLEKETSVIEKLQNDLLKIPARDLYDSEYQDFEKLSVLNGGVNSLSSETFTSLAYSDKAVLLKSNISGVAISTKHQFKNDKSIKPYILVIDSSGELVKSFDLTSKIKCDCSGTYKFHSKEKTGGFSTNLIQYNSCGGQDWAVPAKYTHHHFQMKSRSHVGVWAWDGLDMVEYSLLDGNELQRISLGDVINKNPNIHIFEARLAFGRQNKWAYGSTNFDIKKGSKRYEEVENADWDPFHPNDIEPLTKEKADSYEMFEEGDLLVSLRSINLVFVFRPSTKEIIWHIYGLTSRQHDPDWNNRGSITIFDNKYHNGSSTISSINPHDGDMEALVFSTSDFLFFKPTGGNHEISDDGDMIFFNTDSAVYGRSSNAISNEMAFVFLNRYKNGKFVSPIILDVLDHHQLNDISSSECR